MGENGGKEESKSAAFGLLEEDAVDYYFSSSSSSSQAGLGLPPAKKKQPKRTSFDDEDFLNLLHGSDPFKIELNRLQNLVKDKDRELSEAYSEIKGLRLVERAKDKALAEVSEELNKMVEKLQLSEAALESKNLEIKRVTEEKKEALAAQFAAEATLRRVHAAQKDEALPSLEDILFPLEAEIKLLKQEIANLQDDNRVLERLTKTKEAALLEAEREVQIAKVKAALVDDLQNKNQELMKQNEINQEEYKILDRMHRQKVAEVEKLAQTVHDLEEALLSGAAAANAVRDYQRQVNELKGEKKTLERTLSRAMVAENRAAVVMANEWKDTNDKVIPVKQWLEERRVLTGEMQQLREKLSISERAAKAEAQLKERLQLRLKVVEDGLKSSLRSGIRYDKRNSPSLARSSSINGSDSAPNTLSSGIGTRKPCAPSGKFSSPSSALLKHAKGASKSFDGCRVAEEEYYKSRLSEDTYVSDTLEKDIEHLSITGAMEQLSSKPQDAAPDDYVSVVFYDMLQKEVITLRKSLHEKDQCLKDKDISMEMLSRKIDTITKSMEVETKKLRREKAALEKEIAALKVENQNELKVRRSKGNGQQFA
ncbi:microtubule-associated protein 70-1-like [Zingiber officinale]|uniref:microtubule-associated protein 70-1-like n=1 Tax=Zingiber officinale TaxID=94328 RepID=UPI001C4D983B|nr:microtubule-associated protein 70-1-like [Zingiber officinale]